MSKNWISKLVEKKVIDEVGKQLNIDVSKEGEIKFKNVVQCQFCNSSIPDERVFCPHCKRSQK